jgi:general secretion pathway protein A
MYLQYFGLAEAPFSITPDPAFVYLSQRHRDALAHLLYGVGQGGSGGFVQLTGEVGTGKTTLCRCLLEQVPDNARIALVLNPLMTPIELLAAICEELGIDVAGAGHSAKTLVDRLTHFLLAAHEAGERVVVVIDEAQNLSQEALEQVRLLTNLETSKQKLLQIVLLGQPELRDLLQRQSLRQLAQRITARYHLTPLGPKDSARYVQHRMRVAGAARSPFRGSALKALYQRSHGVPRLINIIADRALVGAYAGERQDIDARLVHAAADEVQLGEPGVRRDRWPWAAAGAAGVALALVTWFMLQELATDDGGPLSEPAEAGVVASAANDEPAATNAEQVQDQPPEPEPAVRLDGQWLDIQRQAAWTGLALLWGDPTGGMALEAACNGTAGTGYACIRDTGSWARIRQLGLPVVLVLQGVDSDRLLLQGVDGNRLLVGAPATEMTVARSVVEDRWLGAYYVAWPQAPNWPREIARGDAGPAVETIIGLAAGQGEEPYSGAPVFAAEFERWLKNFQDRLGLEPDGIVGPRTLLYLIRSSISEPALASTWDVER